MPTTPSPARPTADVAAEPATEVSVPVGPEPGHGPGPGRDQSRGRTLRLGVLGSALIFLGSLGAGAPLVHDPLLSNTLLGAWRYGHGKMIATAAIYAGVGLLVLAWIRLGRAVHARRADAPTVLVAIGAWTAPLLLSPPVFTKDLYIYLAQGALAHSGYDPYTTGPSALPGPITDNVSWIWLDTPSPYGPLFILLMKSVVAVTGQNVIFGAVVTRLLLVTGLGLLCLALWGLCRHLGARPAVALWLGAANPLVLVHLVAGAHNDLLMIGLLCTGTLFVLNGSAVRGIAIVAAAAAVKVTAAVALPFLAWVWAAQRSRGARRAPTLSAFAVAAGGGAVVAVVVFGLCTVLAGLDLGWLGALDGNKVVDLWLSIPTGIGKLTSGVLNLFTTVDTKGVVDGARLIGWGVLAALVVLLWWRTRAGGATAVRGAAAALLATVLFSAVTLPWYFSWPLAMAAAIALPWSRVGVIAGVSVWLVLITYPDGDTALPNVGYTAVTFVVAALAAWSLVRPESAPWWPLGRTRRPDLIGRP